MSAPQQIDNLLRHAEMQEQKAQAHWLQIRHQVEAAKAQLAELQRYVQDYGAARLQGQMQVRSLHNLQVFTERLSEAVVQQSQSLRNVREKENQAQKVWQQHHAHLEALRLMRERRELLRDQQGQRREQHRLDEISSSILRQPLGGRHA